MKRVGDVPQSGSGVGSESGSDHTPFTASVVAFNATIASVWVCEAPVELYARLPVVTKTELRAASTTGLVQIPPPTWPSGTTFQTLSTWRERRSTRISLPWTSGESQWLAIPM